MKYEKKLVGHNFQTHENTWEFEGLPGVVERESCDYIEGRWKYILLYKGHRHTAYDEHTKRQIVAFVKKIDAEEGQNVI